MPSRPRTVISLPQLRLGSNAGLGILILKDSIKHREISCQGLSSCHSTGSILRSAHSYLFVAPSRSARQGHTPFGSSSTDQPRSNDARKRGRCKKPEDPERTLSYTQVKDRELIAHGHRVRLSARAPTLLSASLCTLYFRLYTTLDCPDLERDVRSEPRSALTCIR